MAVNILIVDDEKNIRSSLRGILEDEGYVIDDAANAEDALEKLKQNFFQIIFLDVMLPGMNGLEALKKIKQITPESYVIMMSGHANLEMAVEATRLGAFNFFEKPLFPDKIILEVKHINNRRTMEAEVTELRKLAGFDEMIGSSPVMMEMKKLIAKFAPSDSRVLITGENGTGKELIARAIHYNSGRKNMPFIKINCAALPKDLIESELFGYEKGAFTGAVQRKIGRIEEAHKGTLFLDEIGDMSLDTQAKLLRVLEENELVRLGGNKTISFDVRIISATNKDILSMIANAEFRDDLYYRLRVIPVNSPPLRERREDIPELIDCFAQKFTGSNEKMKLSFDDKALEIMCDQQWRGNVRELKNVVERIAIMTESNVITAIEVLKYLPGVVETSTPTQVIPETDGSSLRQMIDTYEEAIIRREYSNCGENVSKLAIKLKVDRANLHRKLKQIGIK